MYSPLCQADYYQSTSWMSEEERAAAKAKDAERSEARKASRLRKPISVSFDIAGRYIMSLPSH